MICTVGSGCEDVRYLVQEELVSVTAGRSHKLFFFSIVSNHAQLLLV